MTVSDCVCFSHSETEYIFDIVELLDHKPCTSSNALLCSDYKTERSNAKTAESKISRQWECFTQINNKSNWQIHS